MSDKDKISFNEGEEEEFHITDEDIDRELAAMEMDQATPGTDDATTEEGDARAVADKPMTNQRFAKLKQLKRKHWIIIAIVVIVLLFGFLKFFGDNSSSSFDQITPVAVQSTPVMSPIKSTATDFTKTTSQPQHTSSNVDSLLAAPILTAPNSANPSQLKTDLTALAGNENKLLATLDVIQQQNKMLTQQLTSLSGRVQGLESSFNQSNQAVEGLSHQMVQMKTGDTPSAPLIAPPPEAVAEGAQYTVEAVVPQRAWLQTADGSTITVMMGDEVPNLGTVVAIDPYSGNVTTSSGTVIKYGN